MAVKVYKKRGQLNYKERKLVNAVQSIVDELADKDPNFEANFEPAETYEQLFELHNKYAVSEAELVKDDEKTQSQVEGDSKSSATTESQDTDSNSIEKDVIDPLNRQNPKVRKYVLEDTLEDKTKPPIGGNPVLDEPSNADEAFRLPLHALDDKEQAKRKKEEDANQNQNSSQQKQSNSEGPRNTPNAPLDDLSDAKRKKQTRKFATHITRIVCDLMEHGYVWFVTKDIDEAKLANYVIADKITNEQLDFLLTLSEEQQITVREFFRLSCANAQEMAKISDEDRKELAEALADVLEEKGIAPTPMQNLLITFISITAGKAIPAFMQITQNNTILKQLMTQRSAEKAAYADASQDSQPNNRAQAPVEPQGASQMSDQNDNGGDADAQSFNGEGAVKDNFPVVQH